MTLTQAKEMFLGAGVLLNLPFLMIRDEFQEIPETEEEKKERKVKDILSGIDSNPVQKVTYGVKREMAYTPALIISVYQDFNPFEGSSADNSNKPILVTAAIQYEQLQEITIPVQAINEVIMPPKIW